VVEKGAKGGREGNTKAKATYNAVPTKKSVGFRITPGVNT